MAVPTLGTDPIDCWAQSNGFNWLTDDKGLKKDYRRGPHDNNWNDTVGARLLLFQSESVYQGNSAVNADLADLAYALVEALYADRDVNVRNIHCSCSLSRALGARIPCVRLACDCKQDLLTLPPGSQASAYSLYRSQYWRLDHRQGELVPRAIIKQRTWKSSKETNPFLNRRYVSHTTTGPSSPV